MIVLSIWIEDPCTMLMPGPEGAPVLFETVQPSMTPELWETDRAPAAVSSFELWVMMQSRTATTGL
jgi:hypothetical protein